jgi:hypothetical protein
VGGFRGSINLLASHTPIPSGCIGQSRDSKPSEGGVGCNPRMTFDGKVTFGTADILFASSNSIPPYLTPPRPPAPVSTGDGSGLDRSSDGQEYQSRIVLPPETGEQPSLSSGLSDAPRLKCRRPGSLLLPPSSSSSSAG